MPFEIHDQLRHRVVLPRPTREAAIGVAVKGLAKLPGVPKEPRAAWKHLQDEFGYRAVEVRSTAAAATTAPFVYLG